jgi:hypothetical protein
LACGVRSLVVAPVVKGREEKGVEKEKTVIRRLVE